MPGSIPRIESWKQGEVDVPSTGSYTKPDSMREGASARKQYEYYQPFNKEHILTMAIKTKLSIAPLADRVVVEPASKEEVSVSGIIIPDTAKQEKPERGTVVAVGPGKFDDGVQVPMSVKIGDTVLFSKYGYDEVKIDGTEYLILAESSILGIIND